VVALYAVGFLFATAAVALAIVVDLWLAVLIVALALFAVAALLGLLARSRIKKATPPVPEQAIREAKLTSEALRSNDHH
jgi:multisubunit Na+/H+ antiporter MnhC subunit